MALFLLSDFIPRGLDVIAILAAEASKYQSSPATKNNHLEFALPEPMAILTLDLSVGDELF
jgi:hypothetical protein